MSEKLLQKWKAIVHEIEERREAIINADSKKLNELIEYINKKERHKQDELLELINQSSITNSLNQKEKQP